MPLANENDRTLFKTLNGVSVQETSGTWKQLSRNYEDLSDTDDENVHHGSKEEALEEDSDNDEMIVGLNRLDFQQRTPEAYMTKGPTRGGEHIRHQGPSYPYERPNDLSNPANSDTSGAASYYDQLGISEPDNLQESYPGIPGHFSFEVLNNPQQLLLDCIDDAFGSDTTGSRIGLKAPGSHSGYYFIKSAFSIDINEYQNWIGVHVERKKIPKQCHPTKTDTTTMDIFLQLDADQGKLIKIKARVEKFIEENGCFGWTLLDQMLKLEPFRGGCGVSDLIHDVPIEDLEQEIAKVERLSQSELLKPFGPNDDSYLSSLCVKDENNLRNKAHIFAAVKRLLRSRDPKIRKSVLKPSKNNFTPLIFASLTNKASVAKFLAEIYYDLGGELTASKPTLIDMLVRTGDSVADTLEVLLQMKFHDGSKLFKSQVRNRHGEMAIHMATSKVDRCPHRVIHLLYQDHNGCMTERAKEGMLPLHYACQYSPDPSLLELLLSYDKSVINAPRDDGFTPLHLVAARSDAEEICHPDPAHSFVPLEEEVQCKMIRILLENGADKTIRIQGYLPLDFVTKSREQAKKLLSDHVSHPASEKMSSKDENVASPNSVPLDPQIRHDPVVSSIAPSSEVEHVDAILEELSNHADVQNALDVLSK